MSLPMRGRLAVPALLLMLTTGSQLQAQGERLFEQGLERYRAGNYAEAQRQLREYVQAYGDREGDRAAHLGEAYHYLGLMTADARLAEGYFLAVVERYPSAPVADESAARLAQLYTVLGNFPEARKQWQALARGYPLSEYVPQANLRIGETYFAEGDLESAYEAFTAGLSRAKQLRSADRRRGGDVRDVEGEYVYWLGRTLLARRSFGDARKYLNLVLLDYPGHPLEPLALYYLTEAYREDGKAREADESWRRFSESVRNTSLETLAENPNLLGVALARESGALERPPEADRRRREAKERASGTEERQAGDRREVEEKEPREVDEEEPTARAADAESTEGGRLRAPQPGRPGGVAEEEAAGRGVEQRDDDTEDDTEDPREEDRRAIAAVDAARSRDTERSEGEPEPEGRTIGKQADRRAAGVEEPERGTAEDRAREAQIVAQAAQLGAGELPEGVVYLQVGAFTSAESAGKLSAQLRKKGFEPSLHSGLVNGQGYYRVRFGPYESPRDRAVLESTRTALLKAGFDSIVMRQEPK